MSAKVNFTENQQKAIDLTDQNLLVSASAGSGKTAVLVERVIQKILHGVNIDELLVVTFTEAAAAEMKLKIQVAIQKAISDPKTDSANKRILLDQLNRLSIASISTLHAFCLQLIKRFYYKIDLDPNFRLLTDDTEGLLLREGVWEELREELYADIDGEFAQLTANFASDRNDQALTDLVMQVYNFANAKTDPAAWLSALSAGYEFPIPFTQSALYQRQVLPLVTEQLTLIQLQLTNLLHDAQDLAYPRFIATLETDVNLFNHLVETHTELDFDALRAQIRDFSFSRLATAKKAEKEEEDTLIVERLKDERKSIKEALIKLGDDFFILPETEQARVTAAARKHVETLASTVLTFSKAYAAEKKRRHVLDFSDLEHFAFAILQAVDELGQTTADTLRETYVEIMIDEYQDTNQLQEAILTSISKQRPGNRFMVGDVKQSIYGFRLADPSLFLDKYQAYREEPTAGQLIVLQENFRSMPAIDAFTNYIFRQLMDPTLGKIAYDDQATLKFGATYYPSEDNGQTELLLYDIADQAVDNPTDTDQTTEQDFKIDDVAHGEAALVADAINLAIESKTTIFDRQQGITRPLTYRDIVLLVPTRNNNLALIDVFKRFNIPLIVNDAQEYFQTTEIQIMMSLLWIIDNPYQDIPLVAVLRSAIVGLDENELAEVRIQLKDKPFYDALTVYADAEAVNPTTKTKVNRFLAQLAQFRETARDHQLVTLIWQIYQTTGFLDYVGGMPAGAQRQANLHALYDRAHAYEKTSFRGLYQFVTFIEKMQEKEKDLNSAVTVASEDAVTLMTIHGSKGLEFPVVYLMNAGHHFNLQSTMGDYVLNDRNGLGITYLDPTTRIKAKTMQQSIITVSMQRQIAEEQMRLLYVALTRAEQKLIIVGSIDYARSLQSWSQVADLTDPILPIALRQHTTNFLDWIGLALARHPDFPTLYEGRHLLQTDNAHFNITVRSKPELEESGAFTDPPEKIAWLKQLDQLTAALKPGAEWTAYNQILNQAYPHTAAVNTTAYQSVSEIKRLFDDPDNLEMNRLTWEPVDATTEVISNRVLAPNFAVPKFLSTTSTPTAAEIGTATHLVLQELPLTTPISLTIIEETITRLTKSQVLPLQQADQINRQSILSFFDSALGQLIQTQPQNVAREVPFSMLLPASQIFDHYGSGAEKILIHGIMDGYYVDDQQVILFDYKTDYVPYEDGQPDIARILTRYKGQVNLYAAALKQMLNRPVTNRYLYLLSINTLVPVPD